MRMGHAQAIEGFTANMQHAQVSGLAICLRNPKKALTQRCRELTFEYVQGVQELNMRMGHAQAVEGFMANMQHAQVACIDT